MTLILLKIFHNLKTRFYNDQLSVFLVGLMLIFSMAVLWPVLINQGWPYNHEWLGWRSRLMCYVFHFKQYDFFPIWSSADAFGLGSPLPLYYHKLFYYLSAIFYFVFNDVKASIITALFIFNFIGVYGLYKAIKLIKVKSWVATIVAICFLFQYYTVTDWFVRGAFAEYSALMLLPLFFIWAFNFLIHQKYSPSIGVLLGIIYHAHSIIAFFLVFLIAITVGLGFIYRKVSFVNFIIPAIKSIVYAILIILLFNFPILVTHHYYDPSYVKFDINYFFKEPLQYLYDTAYVWNKTWEGYTVEFNVFTSLSLIFAFMTIFFHPKKVKNLLKNKPEYVLLIISLLFYTFLQLKISSVFFNLVPGADYIQFPWRLISFIQTIILLILAVFFNHISQYKLLKYSVFLFFALSMTTYPLLKSTGEGWQWFKEKELEAQVNEGVFGVGEYMPIVKGYEQPDSDFFGKLVQNGIQVGDSLNKVIKGNTSNPEELFLEYKVEMLHKDKVIFPVNFSGMELLYLEQACRKYTVPTERTADDPRVRAELPKGNYTAVLVLPNTINVFRKIVMDKAPDEIN